MYRLFFFNTIIAAIEEQTTVIQLQLYDLQADPFLQVKESHISLSCYFMNDFQIYHSTKDLELIFAKNSMLFSPDVYKRQPQ